MVISAEIVKFLPEVVYFGRNKTISAETIYFRPNILFQPNFGFCEWLVSVFGVSAKNLFRSNTTYNTSLLKTADWLGPLL